MTTTAAKATIEDLDAEFAAVARALPEPPAVRVAAIMSADRGCSADYNAKMKRLGPRWRDALATPAPHDQLSELRNAIIYALVKRRWSDGDIWTALQQSAWLDDLARRKGEKRALELIATEIARGQVAVEPFPPDVHTNGRKPPASDSFSPRTPKVEVTSGTQLRVRTAVDIARATPADIPWLAKPWLARGAITELDARIKLGKSTLIAEITRCVLEGAAFLGEHAEQAPVVYITEQGDTTFRELLRRARLLEHDDLYVISYNDTLAFDWPDVVEQARGVMRKRAAGLLIVDTLSQLARLAGDAENNSGSAQQALLPLQEAAADGVAVLIARHERKGGGEVGDSGRGSSAFAGVVDAIVALKRPEGKTRPTLRVLHSLSRFDETPQTLVIDLTDDGYVPLGSQKAVAQEALRALLLAVSPTLEADAVPESELIDRLGDDIKKPTAREAIKTLLAERVYHRSGGGRKGDPYRYWLSDVTSNPNEYQQNELPDEGEDDVRGTPQPQGSLDELDAWSAEREDAADA